MSEPCAWEMLVRRILIEWQGSEEIIGPRMTTLFTEAANMVKHENLHRMYGTGNKPEDASGLSKEFDFLVNRFEYVGGPWPTPRSMYVLDEYVQASKKAKRKLAKKLKRKNGKR